MLLYLDRIVSQRVDPAQPPELVDETAPVQGQVPANHDQQRNRTVFVDSELRESLERGYPASHEAQHHQPNQGKVQCGADGPPRDNERWVRHVRYQRRSLRRT